MCYASSLMIGEAAPLRLQVINCSSYVMPPEMVHYEVGGECMVDASQGKEED